MNKVELTGRLTKDPEIRYSQNNNMAIARYFLAVRRRFSKEGQADTDFISCVAFGKAAEFAEKYFKKGTKIEVVGRIQTGSFTNKNGEKVYTTDVIVEEQEFAESKSASGNHGQAETHQQNAQNAQNNEADFMDIPDGFDDELPFK